MRYRMSFLVGLAVGYVLGTRAGRERYEQLKQAATDLWNSPAVKESANTVRVQATQVAKSTSCAAAHRSRELRDRRRASRAERRARRAREDREAAQLGLDMPVGGQHRHGMSRLIEHVPGGFGRHHHDGRRDADQDAPETRWYDQ